MRHRTARHPEIPAVVLPLAAALLALASCGPTGPDFSVGFPVFSLQDIDCSSMGAPVSCCFIGSSQDGVFCAGSFLCFVDHDMGFLLDTLSLGYPLNDVGSTADGGYAMAVSDAMLHYVSNDTYYGHDPIPLGQTSPARFLLPRPQGGVAWVVHEDGTVTVVNTLSWTVSGSFSTDVGSATAAALSPDGSAVFVADQSDATVKKLETSGFTTVTECGTSGTVHDMETGPDAVYAAVGCGSEIWLIDLGTGQHYETVPLPATATSVEVTPDGKYVYAGCPGQGIVVVSRDEGSVEATIEGIDVPEDIRVSPDGHRALVCVGSTMDVFVLED
ncbi:hypothetical protein JW921_01080 [Candidatus Fermentibacterales bacterium]|nr:hypothetical protein [Candidatus Fermentibacterales bacterium]